MDEVTLGLWAFRHGYGRTTPGQTWLNCACGAPPYWTKHSTNPDGSIHQQVWCDACLEDEYDDWREAREEKTDELNQDADTEEM